MLKRHLSTTAQVLKGVISAVKVERGASGGSQNVERNLSFKKREKAWDKAGESKDEYFKKRFAHVHAKQKANDTEERRQRFQDQRDGKKRESRDALRDQRHKHKSRFYNDIYGSLKPNPLSEYVYGKSPVVAVLQAQKRELYNKLYIDNSASRDRDIIKLAERLGVEVVVANSRHELNLLTNNGVHNGYVLETKPLLPTPIYELGESNGEDFIIHEDNFGSTLPQAHRSKNKNPFGIYLDGITDPHNVGALIRSAYFLGVDFIVMSEKNSAPLSAVVSKTSVGATEFLPIMSASKPLNFFDKSRANGWTFISAATAEHQNDEKIYTTLESKSVEFADINTLLEAGPCILVLGSEGEGIRTTLKLRSDFLVEIAGAQDVNPLIDSLNVSVAGALLMHKIIGK
jgi:21S rRNA (GM2251-2'-O)-methyltransferase